MPHTMPAMRCLFGLMLLAGALALTGDPWRALAEETAAIVPNPTEPVSFNHCRVTDTWRKYADRLSFGRGQTLALVDDGCDMTLPECVLQWAKFQKCGPRTTAFS